MRCETQRTYTITNVSCTSRQLKRNHYHLEHLNETPYGPTMQCISLSKILYQMFEGPFLALNTCPYTD